MAFKPTKRFWVHLGAGTVAAIIMAWGITQCSGKESERAENVIRPRGGDHMPFVTCEESECAEMEAKLESAESELNRAANKIDSLTCLNGIQADSIVVLNDSLTKVNARLEDCQKGKVTQRNRGAGNNNPRQTRPVSTAKTDSVIISLADSAHNEGDIISNGNTGNVRIEIGKGAVNKGQIFVNGTGILNYTANQLNNTADSLRRDTIAQKSKWINQSATVKVVFVKQR